MLNDVEGSEPLATTDFFKKSFNIQHSSDYFKYLIKKYSNKEECNNSEEGGFDLEC